MELCAGFLYFMVCFVFCGSAEKIILLWRSLTVFCGACSYIFLEFLMEVIYVAVADLLGNLIDFQSVLLQKFLRFIYADLIHIRIKVYAQLLIEYFSKVGTAVSEQWCDIFQFQILTVVVMDIVDSIFFPADQSQRHLPGMEYPHSDKAA